MTSAPKCLASWTADEPTAPDAPLIRTRCPGRILARVAQEGQGRQPPLADGGGFLVGGVGRRRGDGPVFGQADELGVGAETGAGGGEDPVAGFETGDALADRVDLAGELGAEDRPPGLAQPEDETHQLVASAQVDVGGGDGGGADADEDLVVSWDRRGDLRDSKHVRGTVGGVHDRLHAGGFLARGAGGRAGSRSVLGGDDSLVPRCGCHAWYLLAVAFGCVRWRRLSRVA